MKNYQRFLESIVDPYGEENWDEKIDDNRIEIGDTVKFSEIGIEGLSTNALEHLNEFRDCIGIVTDKIYFGDNENEFDFEVQWMPSSLKYLYSEEHLTKININE